MGRKLKRFYYFWHIYKLYGWYTIYCRVITYNHRMTINTLKNKYNVNNPSKLHNNNSLMIILLV